MNGGPPPEGQVDMLDIPGKGRCCVYIARFSYDPPELVIFYIGFPFFILNSF